MVDSTADVSLSTLESSLYDNVQTLLRETSSHMASQKGVLRWSLQKKLEADPSSRVSLISLLVKELDKMQGSIHKMRSYTHVIPVLHTLYYVVIKDYGNTMVNKARKGMALAESGDMIPTSVYQTVYECLMKLLILPSPYSAVALSVLRNIKMEMTTPGSLYQRKVTAEQNLKNDYFTVQEKVFVFADPAVFSASLEAALRAHLEPSSFLRDAPTMEKNVVLRVLQTGLGTTCHISRLTQALEALGEHMAKTYFEEVVLAVEKSVEHGAGGRAHYLNKLQDIYRDILTASKEERTKIDGGSVCSTAMPFPEINFLLWREEEDLWNLLANFAMSSCSNTTSVDEEERNKKNSAQSEGSDFDVTVQSPVKSNVPAFIQRNAYKNKILADTLSLMREKMDTFPGSSPVHEEDRGRYTARVVVMGDDRVLGRLSRAYHSIRERESKHLILTNKLNLRFYYIPVTDVDPSLSSPDSPCQGEGRLSLASLLGRVDPWYNSNVNSLGAAISKLAGKTDRSKSRQNFFLLDTLCYYLRCGTQSVNLPLYSVKMTRPSSDACPEVEEVFVSHLEADIPEFRHLKENVSHRSFHRPKKPTAVVFGAVISVSFTKISLSRRELAKEDAPMTYGVVITSGEDHLTVRFKSVNPIYNTTIKTQNISIKALEHRTLSVCLDKDSRRTYTGVQRVEISPCLDAGCSRRSSFSVLHDQELLFSKYLDKVLSLQIKTFTGVTL